MAAVQGDPGSRSESPHAAASQPAWDLWSHCWLGLSGTSNAALLQLDQALPQAPLAAPEVPRAGLCRDTCASLGDVWPSDSTGDVLSQQLPHGTRAGWT